MRVILFLLLFTFSHSSFAQITTTNIVKVSGSIYNKLTGKKLTEKETTDIIAEYPGIMFEPVYNKYGVVERLLFDPNNIVKGKVITRNEENQVKIGESFPEFVFKTVEGEKIASEKLKGSWVLLRFELFSKMINQEAITSLEKQIVDFKISDELTAIIILADSKSNVKQGMESSDSPFRPVPDGRNFHEMFNIIEFPTTILIDKSGVVYEYYFWDEKIDFDKLKNK